MRGLSKDIYRRERLSADAVCLLINVILDQPSKGSKLQQVHRNNYNNNTR